MLSLITLVHQNCLAAMQTAFPEHTFTPEQAEVTQSTQEKFGHYQCNAAMKLAKTLGQNPRAIAEHILNALSHQDPQGEKFIESCQVAGNGFLNITLDTTYLASRVNEILKSSRLGVPAIGNNEKLIVDFSSPNIAKEMHVGHLRSTIIGDSIARLFEFLQYDVLRLNHLGDWGTQFGMLIAYLKETSPGVLTGESQADLSQLVLWYKKSKQHFDEDEAFKKRSQQEVIALQSGEPNSLKAWKIICDISSKAYQEVYDLLDIKIIDRGESFYNPMLSEVISDLESKHLVQHSDGAKCIFLEGFKNREGEPLPLIVQKSDGGFNYASTDMAAIRHRFTVEKAKRVIYVTDAGQALHFQMIFKAAELAGYYKPSTNQVDHVPFGLVLGPDGKKFRTRSGETERLMDLLNTAIAEAKKKIIEREEGAVDTTQRDASAKVLGMNAIKYADLSCNRQADYVFSYDRMLRFEGNTAAFLMYSSVRVLSIKRRLNADIPALLKTTSVSLTHPSEVLLALQLARFNETLEQVARDLMPNRLCDYLYTLAEKFNHFFRDCHVEGTPEQNSRLLICEASALVLQKGMELLGLKTLERM